MAKIREKEKAVVLRHKGFGIKEIARQLAVSKSTVSYWCRDIPLSLQQINTLQKRSGAHALTALLKASERKRSHRLAQTVIENATGKKDVGQITSRDYLMVGLGLYWGEGYKRGSEELGFTNSDPQMILFFIRFLRIVYHIDIDRLIARISINNLHKNRASDVLSYWSQLTTIPFSQFTKTSFIKTQSKKQYKNHANHYGTLRIKVRRGSSLRRRILGSLETLKESK